MPAKGEANVPKGWQRVRMEDVAEVRGGVGFPPARQGRTSGDYPFIKVSDMTLEGNELFIRLANNYVDEQDAADLSANVFPPGTVVFPKVGAAIATNKKRALTIPTILDNNLVGITVSDDERCDARFLHNWFESLDISKFANVSTVPSITGSRLKAETILLPPLPEQRAIAAVLDSIDDAIEGAEAVIAATGQLRDSLLHDLLTRGLPGQHTEFRDVPGLGTIPAAWDVVRLGDHVAHVGSGVTPRGGKSAYTESGITFIRSQNVHFDGLRLQDVAYISPDTDESMRRSRVQANDVLLNITGASIGRCAVAPDGLGPANVNQHVCIIRTTEALSRRFVHKWLSTPRSQKEIDDVQTGQSRQGLNYEQVRQLTIVKPPRGEQDTIVDMLGSLDAAIRVAQEELAGLRLLKESTADALLTGLVRVLGAE